KSSVFLNILCPFITSCWTCLLFDLPSCGRTFPCVCERCARYSWSRFLSLIRFPYRFFQRALAAFGCGHGFETTLPADMPAPASGAALAGKSACRIRKQNTKTGRTSVVKGQLERLG